MTQGKTHREPLLRIAKRDGIARPKAWAIRIIAVLLSLVVSGIFIFAVTKLNPIQVYEGIFDGAFGTPRRSWVTVRDAMMLLCIGVGLALLPVVIFVVAAFIGFAMGTSWGTIALILPIVIGVFPAQDPLFLVAIGATLGGAVYGDHVSPISDTTILSSAGAQCNHLRHVATQLPYASVVAAVCLVGYIIAGFTGNPWIALVVGAVLMIAAVLVLNRSKYGAVKA